MRYEGGRAVLQNQMQQRLWEYVSVSTEVSVGGKNEFSQGWSLIRSCEIGP